ncbi:MerR family transcriptional regulator [Indiicoccus explosivorum]|uniref:MerR family transcriptional regulator n=1 Tax=Indiicoccus explosivorum TaxID=1917864 RepID=UPI000B443C39|nr:MerR family transcriptional regulator [Indiicoccus explosivorum]
MEYTVQKLAELAGVSARTLRYYDEIGLLKPGRIRTSGYRIYGRKEVDRLQQILFYRELGMPLEQIAAVLDSRDFSRLETLKEHRRHLLKKQQRLSQLLTNVEASISAAEGETVMNDKAKFEGFKKRAVEENEAKYGEEVRRKYGDAAVDRSNAQFLSMTEEGADRIKRIEEEMFTALEAGMDAGDPGGEAAQQAAALHREWLTFYWDSYNPEAHAGVADMYVADDRFKAYYDKQREGMAQFLRHAIHVYVKK